MNITEHPVVQAMKDEGSWNDLKASLIAFKYLVFILQRKNDRPCLQQNLTALFFLPCSSCMSWPLKKKNKAFLFIGDLSREKK